MGATFIDFWYSKNFLRIFNFHFLWLCITESNYQLFKRGLRLFKRLCLLFLPNVPGATFIQGGTFIPDSRIAKVHTAWMVNYYDWYFHFKSLVSAVPDMQHFLVRFIDSSCSRFARKYWDTKDYFPWHSWALLSKRNRHGHKIEFCVNENVGKY